MPDPGDHDGPIRAITIGRRAHLAFRVRARAQPSWLRLLASLACASAGAIFGLVFHAYRVWNMFRGTTPATGKATIDAMSPAHVCFGFAFLTGLLVLIGNAIPLGGSRGAKQA
jgi:hypothetical protein